MKTNFLCLVLGFLAVSAVCAPAQRLSGGLLSVGGVDSFALSPATGETSDSLYAPVGSSLGSGGGGPGGISSARDVNASVAMDFVEVIPETVSTLLEEPAAIVEAVPQRTGSSNAQRSAAPSGQAFHDWLVLRDTTGEELTPVPEPAIYFFGAFGAILFVVDRRRPLS